MLIFQVFFLSKSGSKAFNDLSKVIIKTTEARTSFPRVFLRKFPVTISFCFSCWMTTIKWLFSCVFKAFGNCFENFMGNIRKILSQSFSCYCTTLTCSSIFLNCLESSKIFLLSVEKLFYIFWKRICFFWKVNENWPILVTNYFFDFTSYRFFCTKSMLRYKQSSIDLDFCQMEQNFIDYRSMLYFCKYLKLRLEWMLNVYLFLSASFKKFCQLIFR